MLQAAEKPDEERSSLSSMSACSEATILRLRRYLEDPQNLLESCKFMFSRSAGSVDKITPLQASAIVQTLATNSRVKLADPMQELASSDLLTVTMLNGLVTRLLTNELKRLLKDESATHPRSDND